MLDESKTRTQLIDASKELRKLREDKKFPNAENNKISEADRPSERMQSNEQLNREINDGIHAEHLLRESEDQFKTLAEKSVVGIYVVQDGLFQYANPKFCEIHGYSVGELVNKKGPQDTVVPSDLETVQENLKKRISGEFDAVNYDFRIRRKNGDIRHVEVYGSRTHFRERPAVIGTLIDITTRRDAALKIEERQQYLERVLTAAPDAIITLDHHHHIVEWNHGAERLFGYSRNEVVGKDLDDLVTNADTREEATGNTRIVLSSREMPPVETVRFRKDGTPLNVIAAGSPILVNDELIGVVAIYTDISELKMVEKALEESRVRYRDLVETIDELIWEINVHGIFTYISPKIFDILGYRPDEFTGQTYSCCMPPEEVERIENRLMESIRAKKSFLLPEHTVIHKDGTPVTLETNAIPFFTHKGSVLGYRGVSRNVSARKRFEAQFRQAQKMEAIGTLAGGIAHDFNNLLMGIQGRASLMLMDLDQTHPHYEHLKQQEEIVKSGATLTRQLLGFARGGKYEVKPTDMNAVIIKTADMFGRTKKEIGIHRKLQEDLWTTEVDQGQIEQVFLNLFVNAWQAMPNGGDIFIETKNVAIDEEQAPSYEIKQGSCVKISVTDTGSGMDEKTRQRIFEPFFTTKEMGRGTGLGLASVYGIVKNHNGCIEVVSQKGCGTTFTILVPASSNTPAGETIATEEKIARGSGTILLIDDEQMIVEVGESILKSLGYTVFSALSGKEGIDIFRENVDAIDLVVLDIIMPEMRGDVVCRKLKEINPHIKVLFASGYSINDQTLGIVENDDDGFIQKPFSIEIFSRKIREIMDAPSHVTTVP